MAERERRSGGPTITERLRSIKLGSPPEAANSKLLTANSLKPGLVAVLAGTSGDEVAVLEGHLLDEAVPTKIVNPLVDHHLDDPLARLTAANLAGFARAGSGGATSHRAVFDALGRVVGLAADRLHVVTRVAVRDDATLAALTVGASAQAHRESGEDQQRTPNSVVIASLGLKHSLETSRSQV